MNRFATLTTKERAEVFEETSARLAIERTAIVEKDFWVCWTLAQLYGAEGPSPATASTPTLLFKGGTSLSKVYALIDRFSEDVDLTIDRHQLIQGDRDPDAPGISSSERERRIKAVVERSIDYVREVIRPNLIHIVSELSAGSVDVDSTDPQTLIFTYPAALSRNAYGIDAYVSPSIRLEFGARGELWPAEKGLITSYAAEAFPALFGQPSASVWALTAQRTFWEKATILHAISNTGRVPGERQSRHYSDLARMAGTDAGRKAIEDTQLLLDVAEHKAAYFRSGKARYDLARAGTLQLVPPDDLVAELERDYVRMAEMFTTEPPPFSGVLLEIAELQESINRAK